MANNNYFSGIYSGLNYTYNQLSSKDNDGLTFEELSNASLESYKNGLYINQPFSSYLQTNFYNIDKNGDGKITSDEMNSMTSMMSKQGLTKAELTQLYASGASGLSQDTMNKILEHFDEMDTNHDGRITSSEISAYDLNSSRLEKEDEFNNRRATDMSVFYGSESSSSDSYSLLSYRYKSNKS